VSDRPDNVLAAHARECEDCRASAPPLAELSSMLDANRAEVDAAALSQLALARVAPELRARADVTFWRRLVPALVAALLPLPVVLAADVWLLGRLYELAATWLPSSVAAYIVISYAASALVVVGAAYAAIPLLIARPVAAREAAA
jgi:hypothetical protein